TQRVGELIGLDEVAKTHLGRVEMQLSSQEVHSALHREYARWSAGCVVRGHRRLVRKGGSHLRVVVGEAVGPGQGRGRVVRDHNPERRVGAHVHHVTVAYSEDRAVTSSRYLD